MPHSANRTKTWPRRSCPHRLPSTPSGNSTEVTRSMRRFFLLPVLMVIKLGARSMEPEQNFTLCSWRPAALALFLRSFFVAANDFLNQAMPDDVVSRQHHVGKALDI